MLNIGETIHKELQRQERTVTWLARKLGCSRMAVYRMFLANSIDTLILLRVSVILKHDFFKDLSEEYDKKMSPQQNEVCNEIVTNL